MYRLIVHLNQKKSKIIQRYKDINILTKNKSKKEPISIYINNKHLQIYNGQVKNYGIGMRLNRCVRYYNYSAKLYNIKRSVMDQKNKKQVANRLLPIENKSRPITYAKKIKLKGYTTYLLLFVFIYFYDSLKVIGTLQHCINFLLDEPIGIKQNKIINLYIGNFILFMLNYIVTHSNMTRNIILFVCLYTTSKIIVRTFKNIIEMIKELLDIFQGKNYNKLKNRDDKIDIGSDRVVIAVFLFAILVLAVYNLLGYFILFSFVLYVIKLCVFTCKVVEFILAVDSKKYYNQILVSREDITYKSLSMCDVLRFGAIYCYYT